MTAETHAAPMPAEEPARLRRTACRPRCMPVLGTLLYHLYAIEMGTLRQFIRWFVGRVERGSPFSVTLRRIFKAYHGVDVGMYTHGGWTVPYNFDEGTKIGRYSSVSDTAHAFTHNHPMNTRSTSALFFHPAFGLIERNTAPRTSLVIGHDVWIGHNAIILPSVTSIGTGAVIAAGAVVHKNIPPYAVVTGHPCRVVRYRFSQETIAALLASKWWEKSPDELLPEIESFQRPIESDAVR